MDDVTVRVGKKGVSPELIEEIKSILVKYRKARVKLLRSSRTEKDRHTLCGEIRKRSKARKASLMGNIIYLEK